MTYKPSIRIGDSFRTLSKTHLYGNAVITIERIEEADDWKPSHGKKEDNRWVYFMLEPKVKGKKDDRARFWWFKEHVERIWSKDERSIILYLETCLVDGNGKAAGARMNDVDFKNIERFVEEGLIKFGRLPFKEIEKMRGNFAVVPTHWIRFSEEAWAIAHKLRRERADRMVK